MMDVSGLLPSSGCSHSLTSSQHALQIGDDSGMCSQIDTAVPHVELTNSVKVVLLSHVINDLGLSQAGLAVLFCSVATH